MGDVFSWWTRTISILHGRAGALSGWLILHSVQISWQSLIRYFANFSHCQPIQKVHDLTLAHCFYVYLAIKRKVSCIAHRDFEDVFFPLIGEPLCFSLALQCSPSLSTYTDLSTRVFTLIKYWSLNGAHEDSARVPSNRMHYITFIYQKGVLLWCST